MYSFYCYRPTTSQVQEKKYCPMSIQISGRFSLVSFKLKLLWEIYNQIFKYLLASYLLVLSTRETSSMFRTSPCFELVVLKPFLSTRYNIQYRKINYRMLNQTYLLHILQSFHYTNIVQQIILQPSPRLHRGLLHGMQNFPELLITWHYFCVRL